MATIEIYVKDCTNVRGGMPLTSFEVLSEIWEGDSITLPFGEQGEERRTVVGWTDLLFNNPYPDVVRGAPDKVRVAHVRQGDLIGYLVHGGNYGLRIGGEHGQGQAIVWVEDVNDLPESVQRVVSHPWPGLIQTESD